MFMTKKIEKKRDAFTLIEMLVVIVIVLVIAALAAAFAPRITDSTNLTRGVDNLEQWLLTAKMRAKRDGLATGLRFIQAPGDPTGFFSQFQYIQQPDPLSGGTLVFVPTGGTPPAGSTVFQTLSTGSVYLTGGMLQSAAAGLVTFFNVDFTLGGVPLMNQWLVQVGDYLEVRDGGVYLIGPVTGPTTLTLLNAATPGSYDATLNITTPGTTNYRILRQPRILIGEEPLTLPNNYAVDLTATSGSNVQNGTSGFPEILFAPSGGVLGANAANGITGFLVYDTTMTPYDPNRAGLIAVQTRTGFIGAYNVGPSGNTFYYVQISRESGL